MLVPTHTPIDLTVSPLPRLPSLSVTRKLKVLEAQPLHRLPPGKEGDRRLLLWGVEDALKARYKQYVQLLEETRYVRVCVGGGGGGCGESPRWGPGAGALEDTKGWRGRCWGG
jgi:hypothetical protein